MANLVERRGKKRVGDLKEAKGALFQQELQNTRNLLGRSNGGKRGAQKEEESSRSEEDHLAAVI